MLPVTDVIEEGRPSRTAANQCFDHLWNYRRLETLPLAKSGPPNFRDIPRHRWRRRHGRFRHPALHVAL